MKVMAVVLFGMGATVGGLVFADAWLPETLLGFAGACAAVGGAIGFAAGWFLCGVFRAAELCRLRQEARERDTDAAFNKRAEELWRKMLGDGSYGPDGTYRGSSSGGRN